MPVLRAQEPASAGEDGGERKFPLLPEDSLHEAVVNSIKEQETKLKNDDGTPVVRMSFGFTVTAGDYQGSKIWGETGVKLATHPDCKLRNWLQELLGQPIAADMVIDTDDFIGNNCRILVGHRSWTDKETNELRTRHFVKDVLRSRDVAVTPASAGSWDEPFVQDVADWWPENNIGPAWPTRLLP